VVRLIHPTSLRYAVLNDSDLLAHLFISLIKALSFIKDNPETILMIEKGYKFYFHEESAKVSGFRRRGIFGRC